MTVRSKKQVRLVGLISIVLALVSVVAVLGHSTLSARADKPTPTFTRYPLSSSGGFAIGITVDKAGNPWFGVGNGSLGTINNKSGSLTIYPLKNANAGVGTIKVADDGMVWFTEGNVPAIGEFNPKTGQETDFVLPAGSRQLTPTFLLLDDCLVLAMCTL